MKLLALVLPALLLAAPVKKRVIKTLGVLAGTIASGSSFMLLTNR
jgi:hypothetical protein